MNFRSRAIGIIAGTTLALSIASGAMADAAPSQPTSAELQNKVGGACHVAASSGSIDLGTWVWDGDSYNLEQSSTNGTITFNISQDKRATPAVNCRVTVIVSDLSNTPVTHTINSNTISLTATGAVGSGPQFDVETPAITGNSLVLGASLSGVPTNLPAATYEGTITLDTVESTN